MEKVSRVRPGLELPGLEHLDLVFDGSQLVAAKGQQLGPALVAAQDWSAVNRLMHSLKGNSSTVGAVAVEEVAKSAEHASEGMAGEFEAGRFPARLREVIARTLPQVQRIAQEKRADA